MLCCLSLVSFSHVMSVESVELKLYWLWSPQIVKLHVKDEAMVLSCNLLTIGLILVLCALCFMHLVSGRSLNIILANFFLKRVRLRVIPVGSRANPFLLRVKKKQVWVKYFWVGSGQKNLTRFAMVKKSKTDQFACSMASVCEINIKIFA